jgi:hypothetical protein
MHATVCRGTAMSPPGFTARTVVPAHQHHYSAVVAVEKIRKERGQLRDRDDVKLDVHPVEHDGVVDVVAVWLCIRRGRGGALPRGLPASRRLGKRQRADVVDESVRLMQIRHTQPPLFSGNSQAFLTCARSTRWLPMHPQFASKGEALPLARC